jgi:hypothetical protein
MNPDLHLLRYVKDVPAGQKVAVGPISRKLNQTQAVTIDMLARLVAEGLLDRETLRPALPKPRENPEDLLPPGEILQEIRAFLAEHVMAPTRFAKLCVNDPNLVGRLQTAKRVRRSTVDKIRAFIANYEDTRGAPGTAREAPGAEESTSAKRGTASAPPSTPAPLPSVAWPEEFQAKLDRVERGEVGIGPAFKPRRPDPEGTLGGIATGML